MDYRETTVDAPAAPPPPVLLCANCGTPLTGPFCAQCGQHVADYHRSVWRFVTDFLDNTFCWDNKLLRTLGPLFRWPGSLTQEFMAGRRVRYVHPLRLFLFTSAVCLALLHFGSASRFNVKTPEGKHRHGAGVTSDTSGSPTATPDADADDDEIVKPKPLSTPFTPSTPVAPVAPGSLPGASATPGETPLDRAAVKAEIQKELQAKFGDKQAKAIADTGAQIITDVEKKVSRDGADRFTQEISEGVRQRLSWVALAMLPVFALMLRGLYWQRDSYYFLHLVFSLHYHTFLLMFWTAYSWLRMGLAGTFLSGPATLCLLGVPVYLFLALRRVYGGGTKWTWFKVMILGSAHLVMIFGALAAIGALAFFSAVR